MVRKKKFITDTSLSQKNSGSSTKPTSGSQNSGAPSAFQSSMSANRSPEPTGILVSGAVGQPIDAPRGQDLAASTSSASSNLSQPNLGQSALENSNSNRSSAASILETNLGKDKNIKESSNLSDGSIKLLYKDPITIDGQNNIKIVFTDANKNPIKYSLSDITDNIIYFVKNDQTHRWEKEIPSFDNTTLKPVALAPNNKQFKYTGMYFTENGNQLPIMVNEDNQYFISYHNNLERIDDNGKGNWKIVKTPAQANANAALENSHSGISSAPDFVEIKASGNGSGHPDNHLVNNKEAEFSKANKISQKITNLATSTVNSSITSALQSVASKTVVESSGSLKAKSDQPLADQSGLTGDQTSTNKLFKEDGTIETSKEKNENIKQIAKLNSKYTSIEYKEPIKIDGIEVNVINVNAENKPIKMQLLNDNKDPITYTKNSEGSWQTPVIKRTGSKRSITNQTEQYPSNNPVKIDLQQTKNQSSQEHTAHSNKIAFVNPLQVSAANNPAQGTVAKAIEPAKSGNLTSAKSMNASQPVEVIPAANRPDKRAIEEVESQSSRNHKATNNKIGEANLLEQLKLSAVDNPAQGIIAKPIEPAKSENSSTEKVDITDSHGNILDFNGNTIIDLGDGKSFTRYSTPITIQLKDGQNTVPVTVVNVTKNTNGDVVKITKKDMKTFSKQGDSWIEDSAILNPDSSFTKQNLDGTNLTTTYLDESIKTTYKNGNISIKNDQNDQNPKIFKFENDKWMIRKDNNDFVYYDYQPNNTYSDAEKSLFESQPAPATNSWGSYFGSFLPGFVTN